MKKIILFLCIALFGFLFSNTSFAQNKKTEPNALLLAADKYFNNFEYFLAAKKYSKALKKAPNDAYAMYQLAECSRYYYNYKEAELYYEKVSKKYKLDYPLARYWYASTLKDNGNYTKAIYQFEKFRNETTNTNLEIELFREKANQEIKGCYIIMNEATRTLPDFGIKNLLAPINSVDADYAPIILNNDSLLFLTSSRKGSSGIKKNNELGGSSSDVYQFKKISSNQWEELKSETNNFSKLNTPFNESSGSFTEDGKKYYFTRCDVIVKTENVEDVTCAIYVSHLKAGKWETPVLLNHNINAPGQWNSQPSVSPKGNILFFVSKRPGGIGMHDIWYSTCNYNDNWGPAINMGDKVNTLFMDVSPQYYPEQKALFFSSNGHGGHGGLDIFMTKEDEAFENCINIGYPFNSSRDDFYFVLGNKHGYISSNRKSSAGSDDIFAFDIKDKKKFIQFLGDSIIIPNKALNILPKETEKPITNKAIIASIDNSSMPDSKSITIDGRILSENNKKPVQDLTILLVDTSGATLKTATTDKKGYYKFSHLDGSKKYNLIFQNESISEKDKDQSYIAEKVNVKGSNAVASKHFFENIFFDFDSYTLRPEALKILDELVEYCKDDATVQLELFANTDSYGSSVYNKSLASNRGKVAMEYLVDKGLSQSSIVVNAIGENKSIATNDTELGRQLNRRVEFYILGGSAIHYNKATYVIESNKTVYSMAKEYNMSEEELIEMNGLTNSNSSLPAFTPVRIKKKIVSNELGAPITHETALTGNTEENYTAEEEKAILKNQSINKDFNFKNPEYLKYIDSIENVPYQENQFVDYYTVRPNNALDIICQLYSIDKADLIRINQLDSELLMIGQKLKIDFRLKNQQHKGYTVTEEDTIESLASRFQISTSTLISINHLYGYTLQKEMVLKLSRE